VERDCTNEVSRVRPLGRVPWLPLYRVQSQVMYKELGSPDRAVVSLREGNKLSCLQGRSSCLYVNTRQNMVVIMVFCAHHSMGRRGVTVPAVSALLARWWFVSRPMRRDLAMAFVIISWSPEGIVRG
jgi:hypothetical protein